MSAPEPSHDVRTQADVDTLLLPFYSQHYDESARLAGSTVGGLVELERTKRLLSAQLAPASRVLDIGGGTGVHAQWLIEAGHHVTLLDVVPEHVATARERGIDAMVGDARDLPFDDHSADATLVLGPLYHLADREDRLRTVKEAIRVTRPGGMVALAGITRASVMSAVGMASALPDVVADDCALRADTADPALLLYGSRLLRFLETGAVPRLQFRFPLAYAHTTAALRHECALAGLHDVRVYGVEGPSAFGLEMLPGDGPVGELVAQAVAVAEALDAPDIPDVVRDLSSHLLALARTPS